MQVIPTPCPDSNAALLDAFRHHLAERDLAPATVQAYLSDLVRFQAWLMWVHEDHAPSLMQVRTVDLAAFRTHLIHEQGHPPATVNRRLQGLRLAPGHMRLCWLIRFYPMGFAIVLPKILHRVVQSAPCPLTTSLVFGSFDSPYFRLY